MLELPKRATCKGGLLATAVIGSAFYIVVVSCFILLNEGNPRVEAVHNCNALSIVFLMYELDRVDSLRRYVQRQCSNFRPQLGEIVHARYQVPGVQQ